MIFSFEGSRQKTKLFRTVLILTVVLLGQARSQTYPTKTVTYATESMAFHLSYIDSVYRTGDTLTVSRQISNLGSTDIYVFDLPLNYILPLHNCEAIIWWGGSWRLDLGYVQPRRLVSIGPGRIDLKAINYVVSIDSSHCSTPWEFVVLANPKTQLANVYFDVGVYISSPREQRFSIDSSGVLQMKSFVNGLAFENELQRFIVGPIALRIAVE